MTAQQRVSYRMESTLESVNKAEEMADQAASQAGFDDDTRSGISMSVREGMMRERDSTRPGFPTRWLRKIF